MFIIMYNIYCNKYIIAIYSNFIDKNVYLRFIKFKYLFKYSFTLNFFFSNINMQKYKFS